MWPKFYQIRCSGEFVKTWKDYLDHDKNPIAYQHAELKYFETLLQRKINDSTDFTTEKTPEDIILTYEEENAIRYMSNKI